MLKGKNMNYHIKEDNAEALKSFWKAQSDQMNMIKSFWIENGSISSELKNYINESILSQKNAYEEFIKAQDKLNNELVIPSFIEDKLNNELVIPRFIEDKNMKRYEVYLQEIPIDKKKASSFKGTVLVLALSDNYYKLTEEYLINSGYKVKRINNKYSENNEENLLNELCEDVCGFICILDKTAKYEDFESVYFWTKFFMKNILNLSSNNKFILGITNQDGKLGTLGRNENVIQGSYSGLLKSIYGANIDNLKVKFLDISPLVSSKMYKEIIDNELNAADDFAEIGRDELGKRYVFNLRENYDDEDEVNVPTENDVFVVSGGGKGITAHCIMELCKKYKCKFIILGRSKLEKAQSYEIESAKTRNELISAISKKANKDNIKYKPSEIASKADNILKVREIEENLNKIKAYGGKAIYCSCDILDKKSVKNAVDNAVKNLGQITGIIHGAGVIRDKKLTMKTSTDFRLVYGTKCLGINNILDAVDVKNVKFISFFSSIAAFVGNVGQTDYASGNEYLNKLSYYLKAKYPEKMIMAMNWGPWNGGMVNEALMKEFEKRGSSLISLEEGTEYFLNQFTKKHTDNLCQVVIYDFKDYLEGR